MRIGRRPATAEDDAGVRHRHLLVGLLALALLAAACGGGDDGDGGSDAAAPAGDPDEGATPQYGGSVIFLREAEVANAWVPAEMRCDTACHQAIGTVFETLVVLDENDEPVPFLLESMTPNDDFTVWTMVTREGIEFHDGTPFDAAAVVNTLERALGGALVGRALENVDEVTQVDDRTVEITMTDPWAAFPAYLTIGAGYVASPTWLEAVDAGEAPPDEPVGTGPFVFAEYEPNVTFRVTRNDDYWLSDADGNQYPYLDEIEFLVQEDDPGRVRALRAGDVDLTHTDKGLDIADLREEVEAGDLGMYEMTERATTFFGLINAGHPDSPVNDVRIRRAMAMATDQEFRNESRNGGVFEIANGPFPPGSIGHLDDTGFPTYDPDGARQLVEEYKADTGVDEVRIQFNTTADADNLTTVELLADQFSEVGIEVDIAQIEQGQAITNAVTGQFEVQTWRLYGGANPDEERPYLHSENVEPIGTLGTNFGRIDDPVLDENLDTIRASGDPAEVTEAAEAVNRQLGAEAYQLWFDWIFWAVPHQTRVHGLQTPVVLPDGTQTATTGLGAIGVANLRQVWVDDA